MSASPPVMSHAELLAAAEGDWPTYAATQMLISLNLACPRDAWVTSQARIDFAALEDRGRDRDPQTRRLLRLAVSVAGVGAVALSDEIPHLTRYQLEVLLAALAHCESSSWERWTMAGEGVWANTLPAAYWPERHVDRALGDRDSSYPIPRVPQHFFPEDLNHHQWDRFKSRVRARASGDVRQEAAVECLLRRGYVHPGLPWVTAYSVDFHKLLLLTERFDADVQILARLAASLIGVQVNLGQEFSQASRTTIEHVLAAIAYARGPLLEWISHTNRPSTPARVIEPVYPWPVAHDQLTNPEDVP